jgi:DNA-binding transcriptional MerR regulator
MLRIGEFSALSAISIHMLRHYDKIGLLIPEHIDTFSGYRYYDKSQLVWANRIVALKELGFGLEEIEQSKAMTESQIQELLKNKYREKVQETEKLMQQMKRLEIAIQAEKEHSEYGLSVVTKTIPEMYVAYYRGEIKEYVQEGNLWRNLHQCCSANAVTVDDTALSIAIYYGHPQGRETMDVEVQLSLKGNPSKGKKKLTFIKLLPEQMVASVAFQGSYRKIGSVNSYVADWLEQNHYEITGQIFSIYHNSPGDDAIEDEFITEICFPIKRIES